MKFTLQLITAVAVAVITWCAIILTVDVHNTLVQAAAATNSVGLAVSDLRVTTRKVNATMDNVAAATAQLQLAAQDERKYWNQTSEESAKGMRDLRQLAARLDRSINDKLIPDLDAQVSQTGAAAQNSLEAVQYSAEALTKQLNDPNIEQMAAHLNEAAANVQAAAKNVSDGTKHLDNATADIEQDVHRLTRPPSFAKEVGMTVLDVGAKLGAIVTGFVK